MKDYRVLRSLQLPEINNEVQQIKKLLEDKSMGNKKNAFEDFSNNLYFEQKESTIGMLLELESLKAELEAKIEKANALSNIQIEGRIATKEEKHEKENQLLGFIEKKLETIEQYNAAKPFDEERLREQFESTQLTEAFLFCLDRLNLNTEQLFDLKQLAYKKVKLFHAYQEAVKDITNEENRKKFAILILQIKLPDIQVDNLEDIDRLKDLLPSEELKRLKNFIENGNYIEDTYNALEKEEVGKVLDKQKNQEDKEKVLEAMNKFNAIEFEKLEIIKELNKGTQLDLSKYQDKDIRVSEFLHNTNPELKQYVQHAKILMKRIVERGKNKSNLKSLEDVFTFSQAQLNEIKRLKDMPMFKYVIKYNLEPLLTEVQDTEKAFAVAVLESRQKPLFVFTQNKDVVLHQKNLSEVTGKQNIPNTARITFVAWFNQHSPTEISQLKDDLVKLHNLNEQQLSFFIDLAQQARLLMTNVPKKEIANGKTTDVEESLEQLNCLNPLVNELKSQIALMNEEDIEKALQSLKSALYHDIQLQNTEEILHYERQKAAGDYLLDAEIKKALLEVTERKEDYLIIKENAADLKPQHNLPEKKLEKIQDRIRVVSEQMGITQIKSKNGSILKSEIANLVVSQIGGITTAIVLSSVLKPLLTNLVETELWRFIQIAQGIGIQSAEEGHLANDLDYQEFLKAVEKGPEYAAQTLTELAEKYEYLDATALGAIFLSSFAREEAATILGDAANLVDTLMVVISGIAIANTATSGAMGIISIISAYLGYKNRQLIARKIEELNMKIGVLNEKANQLNNKVNYQVEKTHYALMSTDKNPDVFPRAIKENNATMLAHLVTSNSIKLIDAYNNEINYDGETISSPSKLDLQNSLRIRHQGNADSTEEFNLSLPENEKKYKLESALNNDTNVYKKRSKEHRDSNVMSGIRDSLNRILRPEKTTRWKQMPKNKIEEDGVAIMPKSSSNKATVKNNAIITTILSKYQENIQKFLNAKLQTQREAEKGYKFAASLQVFMELRERYRIMRLAQELNEKEGPSSSFAPDRVDLKTKRITEDLSNSKTAFDNLKLELLYHKHNIEAYCKECGLTSLSGKVTEQEFYNEAQIIVQNKFENTKNILVKAAIELETSRKAAKVHGIVFMPEKMKKKNQKLKEDKTTSYVLTGRKKKSLNAMEIVKKRKPTEYVSKIFVKTTNNAGKDVALGYFAKEKKGYFEKHLERQNKAIRIISK